MPSGISKRQQLRNEKALADLIRTVPGNDRCADCDALTPGLLTPLQHLALSIRGRSELIHISVNDRMGKLERMRLSVISVSPITKYLKTDLVSRIDGYLPVYAVRRNPPQAGNTHFQGQVLVNGHVVVGTG